MRRLLAFALLACACTSSEPSGPAAQPLTVQDVRVPQDNSTTAIAGVVTSRDGFEVKIESGGPNAIPLRLSPQTQVMLDGQKAHASEIREGQLVRVAYQLNAQGEPVVIKVIANSRSVTR